MHILSPGRLAQLASAFGSSTRTAMASRKQQSRSISRPSSTPSYMPRKSPGLVRTLLGPQSTPCQRPVGLVRPEPTPDQRPESSIEVPTGRLARGPEAECLTVLTVSSQTRMSITDPQRPRVWENNQIRPKIRTTTQVLGILILTSKIDDFRGETWWPGFRNREKTPSR